MKRDNLKLRQGAGSASKAYKRLSPSRSTKGRARRANSSLTFVGPSVEGGDKEYVKVLTGDVDRRKPSFV